MAVKYNNPPVIYTVAKLIFAESIGTYSDDKYKKLLSALSQLGFESYAVSKVMGVQLKHSDNHFSALPANTERVGYFSESRKNCFILDENTIELRVSEYSDHKTFLDTFKSLIDICLDNSIAQGNMLREIELHYVDLFAPNATHSLKDMFAPQVSLPATQFHSDKSDDIQVGITSFTRILDSGSSKVSVNLEQLVIKNSFRPKFLPDALIEPDSKLSMPLNAERLFSSDDISEYAIVHTLCGTLLESNKLDSEKLRTMFESQYKESRKTFDHMINDSICNEVWQVK